VGSGHGPYCNRDINTGAVDREGEKKFTRIIISQFLFFCSPSASFFLSDSGHQTSSSLTRAERPSTTTATHNSDWANGHRNACQPREYGIENSQIPIHLSNNGMHSPYIPQTHDTRPNRTSWDNHPYTSDAMGGSVQDPNFARNLGNLPKLHFPSFDGGNPKLWQTRCEDYFLMYSVDPRMWIKVASMQFVGPATIWLQSIEYKLVQMSWGEFGRLIQERFGKDQSLQYL
jgi:hypothetical protein